MCFLFFFSLVLLHVLTHDTSNCDVTAIFSVGTKRRARPFSRSDGGVAFGDFVKYLLIARIGLRFSLSFFFLLSFVLSVVLPVFGQWNAEKRKQ